VVIVESLLMEQQLYAAIHEGQIEMAKAVIPGRRDSRTNANVSDINWRNSGHYGRIILHIAAQTGCDTIIRLLLLRHDLAINQQDDYGYTALHTACNYGRTSCVRLLLSHFDIKIGLVTTSGPTPLNLVVERGRRHIIILLNSFNADPRRAIFGLKMKLDLVADFFVLILFVCDGLLKVKKTYR